MCLSTAAEGLGKVLLEALRLMSLASMDDEDTKCPRLMRRAGYKRSRVYVVHSGARV